LGKTLNGIQIPLSKTRQVVTGDSLTQNPIKVSLLSPGQSNLTNK